MMLSKPKLSPISKAVFFALSAIAASAHAQNSAGAAEPVMQRVEVTGSNIKRMDTETASPVTVLRRDEIKATGANTVRQILDTLTSFDTGTLKDDGSSSSFARGASGASMRGLGKSATLVLVNGRRVSNYAFADGGKETFVNVDSIPADAIERVEVLKDGASAVYGSDALAGVINIITRKSYQGVSVSANYQQPTSDSLGKQTTVGVLAGYGDLEKDRYNVFFNIEGYKREGYKLADVIGKYPSYHKKVVSTAFGDPSLTSYPGNLNQAAGGGNPAVRQAVKGCSVINATGLCTSDLNGINPWSDGAERVNMYSALHFKLSDTTRGFAEVSYSETRTNYEPLPFGMAAGSPWNWFDGNKKQSQSVQKPKLPANSPYNPYNFPVGLDYRFMDSNLDWSAPSKATQYRVMAGLEGTIGAYDWEATVGRTGGDGTSRNRGPHRDRMPAAIVSGEYKLGGQNSDALLASMFPVIGTDAELSTNFLEGKLSGELMALPAGPLSFAFGAEVRQEKQKIKSLDNVMNAEIISQGSLWIDGQRTTSAAYLELNAPVVKGLELNGALRLDKAPGFSAHVSPKLGASWKVVPQLLLRGTVSGGFRAPNIPETLGKVGLTGFFNSSLDPKRCDTATAIRDILRNGNASDKADATTAYNSGCLTSIPAMISSSSTLKPETSRSITVGFVAEPVKNFTIALDYFKIERKDQIDYRDVPYVLEREDNAGYSDKLVRNPISDTDRRLAARANTLKPGSNIAWGAGTIQSLLLSYENFGKTDSQGVDIDLNGRISAGEYGTVTLGLASTVSLKLRSWDIDANTYRPNTVGNLGVPRVVSVLSAAWRKGPMTAGVRVNYTSAQSLNYDETDEARWGEAGCRKALAALDANDLSCRVASDVRTDLNFAYTGIKNLRLLANINNVFERDRPMNVRTGYVWRPRTLKVGAEYTF